MTNKVRQLAQDSQLMKLGRAQMQICLALNDYLSPDRLSELTAVIPQGLSQTNMYCGMLTGAPAFEAPCFFCRSLLKDGWRCVSGKQCCWNRPADWLGAKSSLDGLDLRSGLLVNLVDIKTPSCRSLTVNWTWGS